VLIDEIEAFFVDYHRQRNTRFKPIGRCESRQAMKLLKAGIKAASRE
jgi:hypothetical protein